MQDNAGLTGEMGRIRLLAEFLGSVWTQKNVTEIPLRPQVDAAAQNSGAPPSRKRNLTSGRSLIGPGNNVWVGRITQINRLFEEQTVT